MRTRVWSVENSCESEFRPQFYIVGDISADREYLVRRVHDPRCLLTADLAQRSALLIRCHSYLL